MPVLYESPFIYMSREEYNALLKASGLPCHARRIRVVPTVGDVVTFDVGPHKDKIGIVEDVRQSDLAATVSIEQGSTLTYTIYTYAEYLTKVG